MSVEIIIPAPLRKHVNNKKRLTCEATSVKEVFDFLKEESHVLVDHLLEETGELREFIKVFVNKKDIGKQGGMSTTVSAKDVVSIVPAFAGG